MKQRSSQNAIELILYWLSAAGHGSTLKSGLYTQWDFLGENLSFYSWVVISWRILYLAFIEVRPGARTWGPRVRCSSFSSLICVSLCDNAKSLFISGIATIGTSHSLPEITFLLQYPQFWLQLSLTNFAWLELCFIASNRTYLLLYI